MLVAGLVRASALLAVFLAGSAMAHEFWIQPSTFRPRIGEAVGVRLLVGAGGEVDEFPRDAGHLRRFETLQGDATRGVAGLWGQAPAGWTRFPQRGAAVIVYQSRETLVRQSAPRFEEYLRDEGLEPVIATRTRSNAWFAEGRESFTRHAKALIAVGGAEELRDAHVGLPLELVIETDLLAWRAADPLPVRLFFDGAPLPDRIIKLIDRPHSRLRAAVRTDDAGRALLYPPSGGPWLLAAVHILPATGVDSAFDWESFWASESFALPE